MKTVYAFLLLLLLDVYPLFSQMTTGGYQGTIGQGRGLPTSGQEIPEDLGEVIERTIKDNPEQKKEVEELFAKKGLPPPDTISIDEAKHLVIELLKDRDKRSQPVDPVQAGAILVGAWLKTHPGEPVPPDILALKNEKNCSSAAVVLVGLRNELRKKDAENFFTPSVIGGLDDKIGEKANIELAIKIMDSYIAQCLSLPSVLEASLLDWLSHTVGVLQFKGIPEHCIGTLIGAREVLTARHCIFQKDYEQWKMLPWKSLQFSLPANPGQKWEVEDMRESSGVAKYVYDDTDDANDWLLLVLKSPALTVPAPKISAPQSFDQLLLFSFQPLLLHRDVLAKHIGLTPSASVWAERVRVDKAASCRISLLSDGGCLTHGCQSEGGVSGAPLFRVGKSGEMPTLVGIHQGSTSTYKGTCLTVDEFTLPNRGRALSETFLTSAGVTTTQTASKGEN